MYKVLNTTSIQDELIMNYSNYNISDEEFICLCQLKTFDHLHIDILEFLKVFPGKKAIISSLATKNIIKLNNKNGIVFIDLSPLYGLIENSEKLNQKEGLTSGQVDKLIHILARNLNPNEIVQINGWLKAGVEFSKVEEAIYTALGKGVNNLNYIEKIVLNNSNNNCETKTESIKRNWTY